ncbi:septin domain-containing protein [Phthorimaea operculella]|nr:septin domain-containing protein [Phthorimaea operculella]
MKLLVGLDFKVLKRCQILCYIQHCETGLGKSTLMDSLFNTNFESTPSPHNLPTVKLKAQTYELQESNVRLKLTICDTVGYGDQVNKEDSFKAVVDYIDAQFEAYLQEELKIKRSLPSCHDSRLHVCLYFICPTDNETSYNLLVSKGFVLDHQGPN